MRQHIYPATGLSPAHEDARRKFRLLWEKFSQQNYMWTLLTFVRAFEADGLRVQVKYINGTRQCYILAWDDRRRYVVRYIQNLRPVYGLYPNHLDALKGLIAEEDADEAILAIRTVFIDRAAALARQHGITLRDGFDLHDLMATTCVPDDPNPPCPACGNSLFLKVIPEMPEGIAWACSGVRAKKCDSPPRTLDDIARRV